MPVTPRGDASLALLHEVIDVQRPECLADRPRIRVVQEVVDQRQRPQDVDLRALVIADDLFGDRKGLHDLPEEPDVHMLPGGFHRQVMQLLDREGLELRWRRHRLSLAPAPATAGASVPGFRYAARKPKNTTTGINGPGVVYASASPATTSSGDNPKRRTTSCAT